MDNVVDFLSRTRQSDRASNGTYEDEPRPKTRARNDGTMHTLLFRSRELILESDEADLVRDVRVNISRAQTKLRLMRERLQVVEEWAAQQVEELKRRTSS
jgi:hypothetical protein